MSYNISEKQINEFKEAFSLYDPQNLGALPITELGKLMRSVGQTPTEKEVQEIIRTLKEEGKQTMDFQDFLQIMAKNMKDCIPEEKVIEAFKVFDKEGKGLISAQELRHIMTSIGQ
ncbi:hypothetical protein Zmor_012372 [Zophobas morio]|uniref:EF-hand domain-containing protein n=1 Tax=Zophobas morio TaxID=2755281 RepID=A0AA38HGI0_9CUCU|nr:hypothetical protein Zmor_012372 [Zophobas morio]